MRWLSPTGDDVQILRFKVKASLNSRSALGIDSPFSQQSDRHRRSYVSPLNRPPTHSPWLNARRWPDIGKNYTKHPIAPGSRQYDTVRDVAHSRSPTRVSNRSFDGAYWPTRLSIPRTYTSSSLHYNHYSTRTDRWPSLIPAKQTHVSYGFRTSSSPCQQPRRRVNPPPPKMNVSLPPSFGPC